MNFLIVEDHFVSAIGVELILERHFNAATIQIAEDGKACLLALRKSEFDLVILDLLLPETDTGNLIHFILTEKRKTKILIQSSLSAEVYAQRYLQMGVTGFISKQSNEELLVLAVKTVLSGNTFVPDIILKSTFLPKPHQNPFGLLSNREIELVTHLLDGKSMKAACKIMTIESNSGSTLKTRAFKKLGVDNLPDLIKIHALYNEHN